MGTRKRKSSGARRKKASPRKARRPGRPPRKPSRQKPRKARRPGRPPRKPSRPARRPRPKKTRDWRSDISTRRTIVGALKKIAGSLVKNLQRAALDSSETVYLRGIANLKLGKRPTRAQALALLAASRAASPIARAVFGKREQKLVAGFLKKMNDLAFTRTRTPSSILKHLKDIPPGLAMQLADAHAAGKDIFYRSHETSAVQRWSVEGFRRFISNPIYKARRGRVFGSGKFWMAHGVSDAFGRTVMPKKGRIRLKVQ